MMNTKYTLKKKIGVFFFFFITISNSINLYIKTSKTSQIYGKCGDLRDPREESTRRHFSVN